MTTGLERVMQSAQGKEPDRVPVCTLFCGAARRVYGVDYDEFSMDGEIAGKSFVEADRLLGQDGHVLLWDLTVEAHDFGQETEFLKTDTTRPNYNNPMVKTPEDYVDKVKPIQVGDKVNGRSRMGETLKMIDIVQNEIGKEKAIVPFVFGPLGTLSMMRGAEKLFMDCFKHKDQVLKAIETINDVLDEYCKEICKFGVPGVCLDTLFASQTIMSAKQWKTFEAPYVEKLANTIREHGSTVWIHNCGQGPYFKEQIESMDPVGISYAYPAADCADYAETKQKWGDKVTLFGHVNPAERLFLGTQEELMEECKQELDMMKAGGRYILAPGCEFPPNGNLHRALGMVEAAELYGKY